MSSSPPPAVQTARPEERDEALITRAQRGEVEAFAQLYDRYAAQVLTVARRQLGAGTDAEDLLHDVFLEAWQHVRDYDPSRAGFLTWLCVRTRSRAADRLARRSRERHAQRVLLDLDAERATPWPPTAAESALSTQAALERLESPLRTALALMYVAGMTAPEISAHTGVAEGTIRSRLARGLVKLERALR